MSTNIYILKLANNKYYIGKTNNLEERLNAHKNGTSSLWTTKHKFISVEKVIPNASSFDEDKYTLEYMNKYGIDNVRGGQYVKARLDDEQIHNITKSMWSANDCCTSCGKKGHFVNECYLQTNKNKKVIIWCCEYCNKEYEDKNECYSHEKYCKNKKVNKQNVCYRCGRSNHYANNCYAKTDVDGNELESDSDTDYDSD
jgi:hypothetical protein